MAEREREPRGSDDATVSAELAELYRSWGILDLLGETVERMPRQWLQILNIARNLLDGKPVPGVPLSPAVLDLLVRDDEVVYERQTRTVTHRRTGEALLDEPQVRPIESLAEYPRILVNQRMWQFIDADLFLYKLYTHDVLVREAEQVRDLSEAVEETVEELVEVRRPRAKPRQKVLVLRDTSSSMNDNNKGVFAKAVALAYLIKAFEEGAEVGDRSYANTVHARLRARSAEEFAAVARRILTEGYYGTTNLAAALDVTVAEIRREEVGYNPYARAKTEILLISDCENPVLLPPLPPGVMVNTLHLEGGREGLMLADYQERLREIQRISTLFVRIGTAELELPNTARESWTVLQQGATLEAELGTTAAVGVAADPNRRERARSVERLSTIYEHMAGRGKEYRALKARLGREGLGTDLEGGAWARALALLMMQLGRRMRRIWPAAHVRRAVEQRGVAPAGGRIEFRPKG